MEVLLVVWALVQCQFGRALRRGWVAVGCGMGSDQYPGRHVREIRIELPASPTQCTLEYCLFGWMTEPQNNTQVLLHSLTVNSVGG